MVFKGIVEKGSVRLPPEADLPDGTEVRIEPVEDRPLRENLESPASPAEIVEQWRAQGIIGAWKDRPDIDDSAKYARRLRDESQNRELE